MLVPSARLGEQCKEFIQRRWRHENASPQAAADIVVRSVHLCICAHGHSTSGSSLNTHPNTNINPRPQEPPACQTCPPRLQASVQMVFFPEPAFGVAKQFWQHTGMGISSRFAEHCLALLSQSEHPATANTTTTKNGASRFPLATSTTTNVNGNGNGVVIPSKPGNRHYATASTKTNGKPAHAAPNPPRKPASISATNGTNGRCGDDEDEDDDRFSTDHSSYLDERYGRNLPVALAATAKRALRRRISGVLIRDNTGDCQGVPCAGLQSVPRAGGLESVPCGDLGGVGNLEGVPCPGLTGTVEGVEVGPSSRGVASVSEDDVFLYPTGMAAIWSAHQLVLGAVGVGKSVCFG